MQNFHAVWILTFVLMLPLLYGCSGARKSGGAYVDLYPGSDTAAMVIVDDRSGRLIEFDLARSLKEPSRPPGFRLYLEEGPPLLLVRETAEDRDSLLLDADYPLSWTPLNFLFFGTYQFLNPPYRWVSEQIRVDGLAAAGDTVRYSLHPVSRAAVPGYHLGDYRLILMAHLGGPLQTRFEPSQIPAGCECGLGIGYRLGERFDLIYHHGGSTTFLFDDGPIAELRAGAVDNTFNIHWVPLSDRTWAGGFDWYLTAGFGHVAMSGYRLLRLDPAPRRRIPGGRIEGDTFAWNIGAGVATPGLYMEIRREVGFSPITVALGDATEVDLSLFRTTMQFGYYVEL